MFKKKRYKGKKRKRLKFSSELRTIIFSSQPPRIQNLLKKHNLEGVNKPKRTPSHPKKWGVVLAKEGNTYKLIRFGDNSMTTAGKRKKGESEEKTKRRKSFKARHGIGKKKLSKLSALFWSQRERW